MSARVIAALLGTILAGCAGQRLQPTPAPVSFLRTDGLHIVNERGDRVALRGYNLGSWLLLEPWMVKLDSQEGVKAEKDVWDQIARRFGEEKMRAAVAAHRASFITESDIERLHQLHINFVRVPIWWRVLGDTMYDADGWRYVDQLLDWCERRGMYVLLDLHGAPGGQNTGANILGEAPTGNYWLSDRTATLDWWRKVARRYRDRAVVAGYDLLNEAWGAPTVKMLSEHMDEIYRAIREIDPRHMIFIEDGLKGYYRLPQPAMMGWSNVVYSFHFYPEDGSKFASHDLLGVRLAQLHYGVPVHIGEFSIYNAQRGGTAQLDACLRAFNVNDWSWTLWSYKLIEDNPNYFWSLTGYTDQHLPGISLQTSSYDDILAFFRQSHWREHAPTVACIEERTCDPLPPAEARDSAANAVKTFDGNEILLTPMELARFERRGHLCVEWQNTPPNFGYWTDGDAAVFRFRLPRAESFVPSFEWSSPNERTRLQFSLAGQPIGTVDLSGTGDWHKYEWQRAASTITLPAGDIELRVAAIEVTNEAGAGNLRAIKLEHHAHE